MSGNWLKSSSRKAQASAAALDFSQLLKDPNSFNFHSKLREIGLHSQISALAYDPTQSLLVVGTFSGHLYLFGQAGVETNFPTSSRGIKIKHLSLAKGILCVVDSQSSLSIWDLTRLEKGKPTKDCTISMRSEVTCIETSPSLSSIFLGCSDGTVDVYDIQSATILRLARIPNLWTHQEELLRKSGSESARSRNYVPICTDIKLHPLDPSIIFIAYEGGVALWNIVDRQCERSWEFVLPPGAPGGTGSAVSNLFTERRPAVTCLSIRPDALLFATGHADGSISFVSTVDENVISMRTVEQADVNKTREEDLFGWSPESDNSNGREPVYKLSWSGYPEESLLDKVHGWSGFGTATSDSPAPPTSSGARNSAGETTLTILGGSLPRNANGVSVLNFPPFKSPPSHASPSNIALSAPLRAALKESVTPVYSSFYPTASPAEDFLLIPRDTPHLGMNFDPVAILILTDTIPTLPVLAEPHADRGIDSYSFPPSPDGSFTKLNLPSTLTWSSGGTATSCQIYTLDQSVYRKLVSSASDRDRFPLRGGKASGNEKSTASGFKILVSLHLDLTIRFHDISDHLLVNPRASTSDLDAPPPNLKSEYPRLLHHLTIDLKQVLSHPTAQHLDASRLYKARPWELELRSDISFAASALEVSVAFVTGDIIVSRFVYGSATTSDPTFDDASQAEEDRLRDSVAAALRGMEMDDDASRLSAPASRRESDNPLDLSSVYPHPPTHNTFRPFLAFSVQPTPNLRLAHSDLGFLAIATGPHLSIIDLRGPDVLKAEGGSVSAEEKKKLKKLVRSNIASLTWTICATTVDAEQALRLIVVHVTGDVRLFELQLVSGHWILLDKVASFAHDHLADTLTTFVLNHRGDECRANASTHQSAIASQQYHSKADHQDSAVPSLWVTVTPRGLATYLGIDGPKIYSSSNEGSRFVAATLIERSGFSVVAAFSERGEISLFSLPDLLPITRLSLETALHASIGTISCSTDGDILHFIDPLTIRLSTMFNFKRPTFPPSLELHDPALLVTTQLTTLTTGLTSTLSSYFGGRRISTVAEIEASLSGPNPPPPKVRKPSIAFTPQTNSASAIAAAYLPAASTSTASTRSSATAPSRPSTLAAEQTYLSQTLAWTTDALAQRGEHLNNLSEAMNEAGTAARTFAIETKKMAQQEAAKRTMMGGFTSFFNK